MAAERVFRGQVRTVWSPILVYTLVALAILLPLLLPGHIMTLDMALTPRLPMPDSNTSSYLFRLLLHVINAVLSTQLIEKLLFLLILVFSGFGAHRLVQHIRPVRAKSAYDSWGPYLAGLLYMVNPYIYSRFMAGQYSVLLGYALLPFFVRALLVFLARPERASMLKMVGWALAISIVSIHSIGLMVVVTFVSVVVFGWRFRRQRLHLVALAKYGALGILTALIASSYWLVPLITGTSDTAQVVGDFTAGDQQAFQSVGGGMGGQVRSIMRLQGFWVEARQMYTLPQDTVPAWGLFILALWVLVICGGIWLWRRGRRGEVLILALSAALAGLLATHLSSQLGSWAPLLAGYREPHKFVGLVALCYATLGGMGGAVLVQRYRKRPVRAHAAAGLLLLLPVLLTPMMFWGFGGQLRPRHYPVEWFSMNDRLKADDADFQILFLPWHRYMNFDFAGRIIMNPASDFFDKPVITSVDPEYGNASADRVDDRAEYIQKSVLPNAATGSHLGKQLTPLNIKYVLLAKEADFADYGYLDRQTDLSLIYEDQAFRLYYNDEWKED